jgi:chemotaxis protein methyltransferase CheR
VSSENRIREIILNRFGLAMTEDDWHSLANRFKMMMDKYKIENLKSLESFILQNSTEEIDREILDNITVKFTFFFRAHYQLDFFRDIVLPSLKSKLIEAEDKDLRVWSTSCSTGEEAYTLQVIIFEYLSKELLPWDYGVLGTDISRQVLQQAQKNRYDREIIKTIPDRYKKYFQEADNKVSVRSDIAKLVTFRRFDLFTSEYPFKSKFHIIFCRNVLYYYTQSKQNLIMSKLVGSLLEGGYLFLGESEKVDAEEYGLTLIMQGVYKK